jgi:hypothetical protein
MARGKECRGESRSVASHSTARYIFGKTGGGNLSKVEFVAEEGFEPPTHGL